MPNRWYEGKNQYFINPYNFIPVDFNTKKPEDIENLKKPEDIENLEKTRYTGVLDCSLFTKTPIAIPDTACPAGKKGAAHKEYNFMRTGEGKPMIPASSLRGPIRSMYETLTGSCFSTANKDAIITYRTKKQFRAGLLYRTENGWELYRAKRYIFAVDSKAARKNGRMVHKYVPFSAVPGIHHIEEKDLEKYTYGEKIYFTPLVENHREVPHEHGDYNVGFCIQKDKMGKDASFGERYGYFCKGEPFTAKKHFESIFTKEAKVELPKDISFDKCVENLDEIIRCYNDEKLNINAKKDSFYQGRRYHGIEPGTYLPIWYSESKDHKKIYLSVAALGRSVYNRTMGDMLGNKKSCSERKHLCPACRLFGMAKNGEAVGSRIRITDAVAEQVVPIGRRETLKELSSPKPSYLPFYLDNRSGEEDTWSYDSDSVSLKGRKFYWHSTEKEGYLAREKNERNASMELLGKEEMEFSFYVYYDNITEQELRQLIWVLTFGENKNTSNKCYKIGHGKPIGLGSVKIVINKRMERKFSENGYISSEEAILEKRKEDFDQKILNTVLEIVDLDACKFPVSYPAMVDRNGVRYIDTQNVHAAHQWFSKNFTLGRNRNPEKLLPEIGRQNDETTALQWITDGGAAQVPNGKITKFFHDRGFGFVQTREHEKVFLHCSKMYPRYDASIDYEEKEVYVEVEQGEKGLNAKRCTVF